MESEGEVESVRVDVCEAVWLSVFDAEEVFELDGVSVELELHDGDEENVAEEEVVKEGDLEGVELGVFDPEGV